MPTPIGISRNFTVSTVTDGITYSIDVSPSSVTIPADETSVSQNFNFYFYKKEGTGAKEAYSCYWAIFKRVGSTYTRLYGGGKATSVTNRSVTVDSTMDSLFIRIGDSSMASASNAFISEQPISITKQGDTGEQGPEGDAAEAYTIVVESAVASVSANGKLNANIVAHVVKTVGATSSVYPSGLTCKIGKQTVSPQARQSDDPYTFIVNNGDWINTSTYNKASMVVLSFTLNSLVLATSEIPISVVGQMGRNIYFAGEASDLQGTTFQPTDNMAPYVRSQYTVTTQSGTSTVTKYFVYVGESVTGSATKTYPNNSTASGGSTGYSDKSIWEQMETNFAYLITKAVFTDFAKLGSAIFNGDFMFSQHGQLGYQGNISTNSTQYQYIDPTDMLAIEAIRNESINVDVSNTSYDGSICLSLGTLSSGVEYQVIIDGLYLTYVDLKIATSVSATAISATVQKQSYKISIRFTGNGSALYLFYKKSGSSPKMTHILEARVKFRPNVYIDWLNGEGFFKNIIVEGTINNLISTLAATSSSRALFGYYTTIVWDGLSVNMLYLNPLKCGSYILNTINFDNNIFFPSYCVDIRTGKIPTAMIFGYKSDGVKFTLMEIRQMVGKRIYILHDSTSSKLTFYSGALPGAYDDEGTSLGAPMLMVRNTNYTQLTNSMGTITSEEYKTTDIADIPINGAYVERNHLNPAYAYYQNTGATFHIAECKVGRYHGHECVYWEIEGGLSPCTEPT